MSGKCLVCLAELEVFEDKRKNKKDRLKLIDSCKALSEQLRVIFILKNILDLPSKQCERFLQKFGNPEEWDVKLCSKCGREVNEIQDVFLLLKRTWKRYEDARRKVKLKISLNNCKEIEDANFSIVARETRNFVIQSADNIVHQFHSSANQAEALEIKAENVWSDYGDAEADDDITSSSDPLDQVNSHSHLTNNPEFGQFSYEDFRVVKNRDALIVKELEPEQRQGSIRGNTRNSSSRFVKITNEADHLTSSLDHHWNTESTSISILGKKSSMVTGTRNALIDTDEFSTEKSQQINHDNAKIPPKRIRKLANEGRRKSQFDRRNFRGEALRRKGIVPQFKCFDCDRWYYNRRTLYTHRLKAHKKTTPTTNELLTNGLIPTVAKKDKYESNMVIQNGIQMYRCSFQDCVMMYKTLKRFLVHMAKHEGIAPHLKCPDCDESFYLPQCLRRHRNQKHVDLKEPVLCHQCGKPFGNPRFLKMHARKCGKQKFKCSKCRQKFLTETGFEEHICILIKSTPSKARPKTLTILNCNICGKEYRSKGSLRLHVKSVHEKNLDNVCELCGHKTVCKRDLRRHQARKHNIGDFKCTREGCGKEFSRQVDLDNHEKFFHLGQEKPKEKICPFCGKEFYITQGLKAHVDAMHTQRESKPHKCEVCGKGFATITYLSGHRRIHKRNKE